MWLSCRQLQSGRKIKVFSSISSFYRLSWFLFHEKPFDVSLTFHVAKKGNIAKCDIGGSDP